MKKLFYVLAAMIGMSTVSSVQADEGFYAGVLGGVNFLNFDKKHHDVNGKTGYAVGGNIGYAWCNGFRLEGEFMYRRNKVCVKHHVAEIRPDFHLSTWTGMANVLYDFDTDWGFTPYIGGGIGYAYDKVSGSHKKLEVSVDGESRFASQLIAGIAVPVDDCNKVSIDYRLMNCRKHELNHAVTIGVRHNF